MGNRKAQYGQWRGIQCLHCAKCSTFLGNDLTRDGVEYTAKKLQQYADFGDGSADVLDQWADAFGGYADDDSFASAALTAYTNARALDAARVALVGVLEWATHRRGRTDVNPYCVPEVKAAYRYLAPTLGIDADKYLSVNESAGYKALADKSAPKKV